jgi:hypothetical protein
MDDARMNELKQHVGKCQYRLSKREPVMFWFLLLIFFMCMALVVKYTFFDFDQRLIILSACLMFMDIYAITVETKVSILMCQFHALWHEADGSRKLLAVYKRQFENVSSKSGD